MRAVLVALVACVLLLSLGLAAAVTRPAQAEFEAFATARLLDRIARMDVADEDSPLGAAALALCKLKPDDCARLIVDAVEVTYDSGPFTTTASARWNGRGFTCTGAFGRFWCRDDGA